MQMDSIPTRRKGPKTERPRCAVGESVAAAGASSTPVDRGDRDDSGQLNWWRHAEWCEVDEDVTADHPQMWSVTAQGKACQCSVPGSERMSRLLEILYQN